MERVIKVNKFGDVACNDIYIYSINNVNIGYCIKDCVCTNWKIVKPKYYIYKDDNCLIEIWYDNKGIILDNGFSKQLPIGYIAMYTSEKRQEVSYEEAMKILSQKGGSYSNKDLMSRVADELEEENICTDNGYIEWGFASSGAKDKEESPAKEQNNGGATDYYSLPENANTLQDLIEHRNMNGSVKDIFKACYRLGIKTEDELRDANKMAYYSLREIGRITGRKDYITIAKELMGSQAIEKE